MLKDEDQSALASLLADMSHCSELSCGRPSVINGLTESQDFPPHPYLSTEFYLPSGLSARFIN